MSYPIKKTSGIKEPFNEQKLRRSLLRSGTPDRVIESVVERVYTERPATTQKLHELVLSALSSITPPVAARYNLKRALMELGPAGYPFERFVACIFERWGYETQVGQIVAGACVEHEVDVIALKQKKHAIVECKFHNRPGLKTDVKVTLYIQARFEDIYQAWKHDPSHRLEVHEAWIATNTAFTSQALAYAHCKNLKLLGWSYPQRDNLAHLIDKFGLHPITSIPTLSYAQKRILIGQGLIMCHDAKSHRNALRKAGIPESEIDTFIEQAEAICKLKNHDDI